MPQPPFSSSLSSSTDDRNSIPLPAVKRLSLYLREMEELTIKGQKTISSKQLGRLLGLTDAQVRKDLGYFGQFGQPGIGYEVEPLATELRRVLGTDRISNVCLVGAGNLGRALLSHDGFKRKGFQIVVAFDEDTKLIGQRIQGVRIEPMHSLRQVVAEQSIRFGIIAVPASAAQTVCDLLVGGGVSAILNFAPKRLQIPENVSIVSVDLAVELEQLAFQALWKERNNSPTGDARR